MNKKHAQEALNRSLSGLRENPYLAQRVIAQAKGETKVKKKSVGALALILVLALAMMGTAYALFSSQVAEFFGAHYGKEMGEWLNNGKIAQLHDTMMMGDVTVALDEVVYRNRGLYAVGTVRAADAKDVLLPDMIAEDSQYYFSLEDESNENAALAQRLAAQSTANGGRLLTVCVQPEQVGVDGGTMLDCSSFGYYDQWNEDGSLTFSFEVEDGKSVEDGAVYQLLMEVCVCRVDLNGSFMQDTMQRKEWTVAFQPMMMTEPAPTAAPVALTADLSGYALVVPEDYRSNGTLPIYRAMESRLADTVQPEWFNQSGIADQRSEYCIEFTDHATLQYSDGFLYYAQYSDVMYDYNTMARERFGLDDEPMMERVPALSFFIYSMASDIGFFSYAQDEQFEHEQLTYLSLTDAQQLAEDLFSQLGLNGYVCSSVLDMSVDRIHALGEKYNQFWYEQDDNFTNQPRMDYSQAAEDDEGYYLVYTLSAASDSAETQNMISMFINRGGIAFMSLRNDFTMGDVLTTPDALVTPEQAIAALNEEASASRHGHLILSVQKVSLVYRAVRADDKVEGMVFVPTWHIEYQDDESASDDYVCWGEINAVNGTLIDAIFR